MPHFLGGDPPCKQGDLVQWGCIQIRKEAVIVTMEENPHGKGVESEPITNPEGRAKEPERGRSQKQIEEVTNRFEKIAEMGIDGILIFNESYQIEFANTIASELTGYTKEDLVGMDFRHLLNERDQGYLDQMHLEVGSDENKRVCTEMSLLTSKNEKIDAEVCIAIEAMEKGGKKTYAYLRDITEKKRMEREIRDATKRFEKIAEMGEDGIIVFDEDSRIEFANQMAAEIVGLPRDQILGRKNSSLSSARGMKSSWRRWSCEEKAWGRRSARRCRSRPLQGQVKETEVCIAPTRSEDSRMKIYAYLRDITERKEI